VLTRDADSHVAILRSLGQVVTASSSTTASLAAAIVVLSLAGWTRATPTPVPAFEHVIVVVFENKEASNVLGNPSAPTFNSLARRYASLTRYYAVTHPSLPNYIALVSGSTRGITSNCTRCSVNAPSVADTLEAAGKTWKAYAEGLPSRGFLGGSSGRYAKKHNPFAYFRGIAGNADRRARIVPLRELASDLRAGRLPDFAFVVPDLCNSMHDCSVAVGDSWLRRTVTPLLGLPESVVFVLFDEGSTNVRGGGHTAAVALGTAVQRGARYRALTGHYGVLRTIEDAWGLPRLGQSAKARPLLGIWMSS
jgi:phosphatidylinositol-3-phosphatase